MTLPADTTIRIDLGATVPAYRQIADAVRARLVAGAFHPGDRLPTVRRLATDLGVHHNTVAEAYRLLATEGWLDLGRRRGATVLERRRPTASEADHDRFHQRLVALVAEARGAGLTADTVREELAAAAAELTRKADSP